MWTAAILAPFLLSAAIQTSGSLDRSIDSFIASQGVADLSPEQQAGVRKIVRALLRGSGGGGADASARRHLEREGFRVCNLSILRVEGTDWLVAQYGLTRVATKDLPILMSRTLFRSGEYLCKTSFIAGVSEFIGDDGDIERLMFAKWTTLR